MQKPYLDYPIIVIGFGLFLTLSFFIVLYVLLSIKRRQQHLNEIVTLKYTYEQTLLKTQLEIQEETLRRISQEIHDNIGQALSLVKLNMNTLQTIDDPSFQDSKQLLSSAISDLRDLSRSMQGGRIQEQGLSQCISYELNILKNTGHFETEFRITGSPFNLEEQKEVILFRIVQETISNIIKHAQAKKVSILLEYSTNLFTMTITDDGMGISDTTKLNKPGIGLMNMRNRTLLIGGSFSFQPREGQPGMVTQILLPTAIRHTQS